MMLVCLWIVMIFFGIGGLGVTFVLLSDGAEDRFIGALLLFCMIVVEVVFIKIVFFGGVTL